MFLRAKAKDGKVTIQLPSKGWTFDFEWNAQSEVYSALLADSFNECIEQRLKEARERAYNLGWKDAKAKRGKNHFHSGWLELDPPK